MREQVSKRKTHTKSRKGCFQCKRRHTKCSETHPRCANCTRLEIECTWPASPSGFASHPGSVHTARNRSTLSPDQSFDSPGTPPTLREPELAIEDLRLLHHWSTKTYLSLYPNTTNKYNIWQTGCVEIGFQHPFLLHGILALAALHKAVETASLNPSLFMQAHSHLSSALSAFRNHFAHPTKDVAIPMFLMSTIFILYNLGSARVEEPENPVDAIVHCFRLVKGVRVVIEPFWHHISTSECYTLMEQKFSLEPSPGTQPVEKILRLNDLTERMLHEDPRDKNACIEAIAELHKTFLRIRSCTPEHDRHAVMFVWPADLPDRFLELLSLHNRVATIILANFAILLQQVQCSWWVQDWPRRIISATRVLLENEPELQEWLKWPSEQISVAENVNNQN
ncbi:hypothetical protein K469DRAFT_693600 [Zopfia rhizophila CBS 207.26]|uniref:Zn(2)-C6 fungal-type domain-containing protein n=1 Tax=Zopfia rhizophila CBS 207.26 TaxID=1314779 RepID=A0A6A6DM12_9PEZI|nr:hypothetical protein K469DRAFT_693600 [Zopfia rhizophila CBS 207.26]